MPNKDQLVMINLAKTILFNNLNKIHAYFGVTYSFVLVIFKNPLEPRAPCLNFLTVRLFFLELPDGSKKENKSQVYLNCRGFLSSNKETSGNPFWSIQFS
jgi:hypothetical protein